MSLYEIYKAKKLGYADDYWTSAIGHSLGGYKWISTDYEQTPYIYRAMPNLSHYYNREIMDGIVGGTVAFNQQIERVWANEPYGTVVKNGNEYAYTVVTAGTSYRYGLLTASAIGIVGHKYLLSLKAKSSNTSITIGGDVCNVGFNFSGALGDNYKEYTRLISCTGKQQAYICTRGGSVANDVIYFKDIILIDLTQMFGSTIADYIYSLEQATAGAGVAWFKKLFNKPYYEYNAGELKSVSGLVSHDMTGFNQWDEEWEVGGYNPETGEKQAWANGIRSKNFIPVLPNTAYYFNVPYSLANSGVYLMWYDADENYLGYVRKWSASFTTPADARYMAFELAAAYGTTYKNDICINLSDASRNGQYEPYRKSSYPLDSTLTLRGIPKLNNGKLYYDGDTYGADGSVSRKYGVVDLGTLNWNYEQGGSYTRFYNTAMQSLIAKPASDSVVANIICAKYTTVSVSSIYGGSTDKAVAIGASGTISIRDTSAGTNPSDFKTAMNGVMLVYELQTPTTETATPFTKTQNCDSGGTEEFVTNGIVSIGHKSRYAEK